MKELTKAEEKAIELLEKTAKHWPKSLWLFSAGGTLHVMKKKDGQQVFVDGGADQEYSVAIITIENSGGDW